MCLHFTQHSTMSTMLSQQILNPSKSIEYEPIESTQSIEYVFETETQESIIDNTDEIDQQSVTRDSDKRCGNCWNFVTANPFLKADTCASCGVHYEHYLYYVVVKPSLRGRHRPGTGRLVEVQFKIPSLDSAFKEFKFKAKKNHCLTFDNIREHDREVSMNLKPVYGFSTCN
jgi:hypothetical protein